jgi:hypothetical protein
MSRRYRIAGIAVLLSVGVALGCAKDENGALTTNTVVFPSEAYVGATVAMALSSNYSPISETTENYTWQADDIEVQVFYGPGEDDYVPNVPVRGVYELRPAAASVASIEQPGSFVSFVLFDLPTELNSHVGSCPCPDMKINILPLGITGYITILGPQGANQGHPTDLGLGFGGQEIEEGLLSQRMIRLRAIHKDAVPNHDGFPDGEAIGSIEFDFWYLSTCMSNVRAYPNSEAAHATTILGPATIYGGGVLIQHVVMVDPKGFSLSHPYWSAAGQGPFLDLAFDWDETCSDSEFDNLLPFTQYTGLLVTDMNGQPLVDRRVGTANDLIVEHLVDRRTSS